MFNFRQQPAYSNPVLDGPVGTIFKFKFSGQNLGGYGGDCEHVAANNSLKTISPLPQCGQILESIPVSPFC